MMRAPDAELSDPARICHDIAQILCDMPDLKRRMPSSPHLVVAFMLFNHQTISFSLWLQFNAFQSPGNEFPPLPAVQCIVTIIQLTSPFACRNGVEVLINTKVESIDADKLTLVSQGKEEKHTQTVAYGACVWATGVAMHPLTQHLQQAMPPGTQSHSRCYISRFRTHMMLQSLVNRLC